MTCWFDHDDPSRLPHRCDATCGMTLAECGELIKTQPIHVGSMILNPGAPETLGYAERITGELHQYGDYLPPRSFVPQRRGRR